MIQAFSGAADAPLSPRLAAAASLVRRGGTAADVGCDHALLSIFLVTSGICTRVAASDVAEGPVALARANVERYGLSDRVTVRLADGLDEIERFSPDDIVVAGMGGMLAAELIGRSEYVRRPGVRLILQPMTKAAELETWLASNGFRVTDELIVPDAGRLYRVLAAEWDGVTRSLSPAEAEVGAPVLAGLSETAPDSPERRYAERRLFLLEAKLAGIMSGADPDPAEYIPVRETIAGLREALLPMGGKPK